MSYHIYQTEGFIIESSDMGESNKMLTIFTKDLGLVRASAQGIRNLRSKLRYSLQEYSFSTIALVRGKEMWRITNARKLISLYDRRLPLAMRKMLARVLVFVRRLMPEEGRNDELFNLVSDLSSFCFNDREVFLMDPIAADMSDIFPSVPVQLDPLARSVPQPPQPHLERIESVEYITKLRILKLLGYGTSATLFAEFLQSHMLEKELIDHMNFLRIDAKTEIDKALGESQL